MIDPNYVVCDLCRDWNGTSDYDEVRKFVKTHVDENIENYQKLMKTKSGFLAILNEIMTYTQGNRYSIGIAMGSALRDELIQRGLLPRYGGSCWINHLSSPRDVWSRWSKFIEE